MVDPRASSRAPQVDSVITERRGWSARVESVPTSLQRFGFGGEDEPPSCGPRA
ncbi:hypothetical protein [Nocardia pseudobrasiliensis]|uniref:hypothetical protein n=1 Tax=Nocardia pseudobrasiliensis TaxID=45979 RepID=UPI000A48F7D1|nr:hypothetical protein [Nocardia pseudobrasiliensis]